MLRKIRSRLARRSFDYQWATLPEGPFLLSDPGFAGDVDRILSEEELCIGREWFPGRRVLDAGCGNGRWIEGFVRLGCDVTALDVSRHALEQVRGRYGDAVRTVQGDVLAADRLLAGKRFDLVFSWGVLHHTEDTGRGVTALSRLVLPDGLLYLFLYGRECWGRVAAARLAAQRFAANLLPLPARRALIERLYGEQAHGFFDALSTPLNDRFSYEEARAMLSSAGFSRIENTMPQFPLRLRADRGRSSADEHFLPPPEPPFWFERKPEPVAAESD